MKYVFLFYGCLGVRMFPQQNKSVQMSWGFAQKKNILEDALEQMMPNNTVTFKYEIVSHSIDKESYTPPYFYIVKLIWYTSCKTAKKQIRF